LEKTSPPASEGRAADYRQLMRRVEQVVAAIEAAGETGTRIQNLAEGIFKSLHEALGVRGARLYRYSDGAYQIVATFPEPRPDLIGLRVPEDYEPVRLLLEDGVVYMAPDDPRIDRELETRIGVQGFAAIEVGEQDFLLSVDVAPGVHRDDVLYSLGVLRHVINQKLRQERMEEVFEQARRIQASILPKRIPTYGAFDLWGQTVPMEKVGGDFYDFIPITDKILGLAIADVSGHGLPAALQVRDVYMGLRMGLARDFKIVRTMERLNQIIHKSALTSRFVSVFYGELEPNGVFIYVNAGHPPPFHLSAKGEVKFLSEGGAVLGPILDASYERGFVRLEPGDMVVLYTDGMIEATAAEEPGDPEKEYGVDRLVALARTLAGRPSRDIAQAMLADVEAFCADQPPQDDRTVVVVTYPPAKP
jgi:sigma-B regulation protein RsbU (phosphoserine phosphatase)